MSDLILFDTDIFLDDLRTGRHRERIESVSGLVRTSSVVLAELWRGARKPAEREFLRALQRNHPQRKDFPQKNCATCISMC